MKNLPLNQKFIIGSIETSVGEIPLVPAELTRVDRMGTLKARCGFGRMDYRVDPGLYALGKPDADTPVFVSANYKMSFDALRKVLLGRNAWILVLDTDGINVWCAAGKGTFGTEELTRRIKVTKLAELVSHRTLIVPQLGAPGVAAHLVRKQSGFRVIYGPVMARDLPVFLDSGNKATPKMRRKRFLIKERAALIQLEMLTAFKWVALLAVVFFFLPGLLWTGEYWTITVFLGSLGASALLAAALAGAALTPLLLPWIPGRAFALKGTLTGLVVIVVHLLVWATSNQGMLESLGMWIELTAFSFMAIALSSYLAMNFTGASTYTSLSGVKREMKIAIPLQISGAALGLVLYFIAPFV
jgi:acetyl-CoA decarbonylase/synthase complex subunit gamma